MEKLKTATGKEFPCDYFNPSPANSQVNLRVLHTSLITVATVFSDKTETAQMSCDGVYAENYTNLVAIVIEGDAIRVVLGKE